MVNYMNDTLLIVVNNYDSNVLDSTVNLFNISTDQMVQLFNYSMLHEISSKSQARCLYCGSFSLAAKSLYDIFLAAYSKSYEDDRDVLGDLLSDIIKKMILNRSISEEEFRNVFILKSKPYEPINIENELSSPFDDGESYTMAYKEVAFKFGDDCDICNKLYL